MKGRVLLAAGMITLAVLAQGDVLAQDNGFPGGDPRWQVRADGLFMGRRDPANVGLIFNTVNPAENLNASDFDFGFNGGYDASIARRFGLNHAIEVKGMALGQLSDTVVTPTTPGNLLQYNAAIPVFTFSGTSINSRYDSEVISAEVNYKNRLMDPLVVLAGFRYLEWDDVFTSSLVGSAVPFDLVTSTHNRLYGGQIGGDLVVFDRERFPFTIALNGKAGLFGNAGAQGSQFSTGVVTLPASGIRNQVAFIGELGVTGNLPLSDFVSIRGGYRMMWIDGLVLATDQLAVSDFTTATGVIGSGDVLLHGGFAGLEILY